jgi:hypothetical protein
MQQFENFYQGGRKKMEKDLKKFLKDPAGNYNSDIGDLVPHGIVNVAGISLLIFDPRHEWPLLYGSSNAALGVIPIAYNGQVNACAHYDAVRPAVVPRTGAGHPVPLGSPPMDSKGTHGTLHGPAHPLSSKTRRAGENHSKPEVQLKDCVMSGKVARCFLMCCSVAEEDAAANSSCKNKYVGVIV